MHRPPGSCALRLACLCTVVSLAAGFAAVRPAAAALRIDEQRLQRLAKQAMLDVSEEQLRRMLPLVSRRLQHAAELHEAAEAMGESGNNREETEAIPLDALPPDEAVPYAHVARIVASFPEAHAGYLKAPTVFARRKDAPEPAKVNERRRESAVQDRNPLKRAWRWFRRLLNR